jgi:VanZ family protein
VNPIGAIKPLKHPRFWLALWCLAVAGVVVVCMIPGPDLPDLPDISDKFEHGFAYFLLAASAVQLYAGRRAHWRVAIGLFVLGIAIEFAQGAFTSTRSMDAMDAVADTCGILLGYATAFTPLRDLLLRIDGRRDRAV